MQSVPVWRDTGQTLDGNSGLDYQMGKGAVYILNMKNDGTVKESFRINEDTPNGPQIWQGANAGSNQCCTGGGQFGSSIASADINGDGKLEIIVGAPSDNTAGTYEGSMWIISYNGARVPIPVNITESVSLTDSMTNQATIALTESLSLTDTTYGAFGQTHIFMTESISFTDTSIVSGKDVTQWISETASLSDSVLVNFHRLLSHIYLNPYHLQMLQLVL